MSGPDSSFVGTCRVRVTETLQERFGPGAVVRCVRTRALGYSIALVFEVTPERGAVRRVFAKVRRATKFGAFGSTDARARVVRMARMEFSLLEAADAWFRAHAPALGVVEPLAYLEDCHALVLLGAEGQSLDAVLTQGAPAAGATHVARAAQWLRQFHDNVTRPEQVLFRPARFARRLERAVDDLCKGGYDARTATRLRDRVLAAACRFDGVACQQSVIHGDYKMRHIWATPDRLQVLDFGNAHRAPVFEDLAAFLVELEVMDFGQLRRRPCSVQALSAVFLDAYGTVESPHLLSVHVALARMKKWSRRRSRMSGSPAGRRLQSILRSTRTEPLVQQFYVDPWFRSRIESELDWLGDQTAADDRRGVPTLRGVGCRQSTASVSSEADA